MKVLKVVEFEKMCKDIRSMGGLTVLIESPDVLGATGEEIIKKMDMLAEHNLMLAIREKTGRHTEEAPCR